VADPSERFMQRALQLAKRGLGHVEPNPMVGAALVRHDQILAEGWHRKFGQAHAEVDLLQRCRTEGIDPAGADLYVTLEPCCHHGKTPPCTEALIEARIARVFVATQDSSPNMSGKGCAQLRQNGIEVHMGLAEAKAAQLNEAYFKRTESGLPWMIAKWAQTLDGKIATATGQSKWISNERSRLIVHQYRARMDAIVVGIKTALADDPQLTARDVHRRRTARRVVIDPQLRLPTECRLVTSIGKNRTTPLTLAVHASIKTPEAERIELFRSLGAEFVFLEGDASSPLNLRPVFEHLATQHQATNVLIEGGARLFGSLFAQQLVDQVLAFVSPKLLADDSARSAMRGSQSPALGNAHQLKLLTTRRLDDDVLLDYRVIHPSEPMRRSG